MARKRKIRRVKYVPRPGRAARRRRKPKRNPALVVNPGVVISLVLLAGAGIAAFLLYRKFAAKKSLALPDGSVNPAALKPATTATRPALPAGWSYDAAGNKVFTGAAPVQPATKQVYVPGARGAPGYYKTVLAGLGDDIGGIFTSRGRGSLG